MGFGLNWHFRPLCLNFQILICLHFLMFSFGFSTQIGTIEATTEGTGTGCIETRSDTNLATFQKGEMSAEIAGLQGKVRDLRGQLKVKQKEITNLLGEKDVIKHQLIKFRSLYCKSVNVSTELHNALTNQDEDAARALVEFGANVNVVHKGWTPLHRAARFEDKKVATRLIKFLIECDENAIVNENKGCSFLYHLVNEETTLTPSQFQDMASYLISKNMSDLFNTPCVEFSEWFGKSSNVTPFMKAVRNVEVETSTLTLLHGNGVDFEVVSSQGKSVLFYAIYRSTRLMSDLISLGANWRHLDNDKKNLLHQAAFEGNWEMVQYLINLGLDVNSVDDIGSTPLHIAVRFHIGDVLGTVKILIKSGAELGIKNRDGKAPLYYLERMPSSVFDKEKLIQLLSG